MGFMGTRSETGNWQNYITRQEVIEAVLSITVFKIFLASSTELLLGCLWDEVETVRENQRCLPGFWPEQLGAILWY